MMAEAKKAVANVEDTVHFLESKEGKALSKTECGAKVMSAIKQLQDLQSSWQKASTVSIADRKAALMKQLKAKEESEKETKEQDDMVANVLFMERTLASAKGASAKMSDAVKKATADKPKLLATVSTYINGRMAILSSNMKQIDDAQKKREAEIKATLGGDAAGAAKTKEEKEEMKKSQAILTMLMKKEARNAKKMRAGLQSEYNELSSAAAEIKKGDLQKLAEVMQHMQGEKKAKSGKFLY